MRTCPSCKLCRLFLATLLLGLCSHAAAAEGSAPTEQLIFDLLYASQDPDAADLSIKAEASNKVVVSFRYPSNGERITIQYLLAQTRNGPRINDVIYPNDTSLRKLLMTKLP